MDLPMGNETSPTQMMMMMRMRMRRMRRRICENVRFQVIRGTPLFTSGFFFDRFRWFSHKNPRFSHRPTHIFPCFFSWLVVWNHGILWLSIQLGISIHPNWLIFFRGVAQPPSRETTWTWGFQGDRTDDVWPVVGFQPRLGRIQQS